MKQLEAQLHAKTEELALKIAKIAVLETELARQQETMQSFQREVKTQWQQLEAKLSHRDANIKELETRLEQTCTAILKLRVKLAATREEMKDQNKIIDEQRPIDPNVTPDRRNQRPRNSQPRPLPFLSDDEDDEEEEIEVYTFEHGDCYHCRLHCGNGHYPDRVPFSEAEKRGLKPCKNCI